MVKIVPREKFICKHLCETKRSISCKQSKNVNMKYTKEPSNGSKFMYFHSQKPE